MQKKPRLIAKILTLCLILQPFELAMAQSGSSTTSQTSLAVAGFRSSGHPTEEKFRQSLISKLQSESSYAVSGDISSKQAVDKLIKADLADSLEKVDAARKSFAKGKELYDQLSLDESIKYLRQAVDHYRDGIASIRQSDELLNAYLYLGMALIILGQSTEGEKYIREMVILDTGRNTKQLSSRDFSPQIINTHRDITKQVLASPSGTLQLNVSPATAKIYLDGALINAKSISSVAVPAGKHYMVAEQRGYRVYSKSIVVRPGSNQIDIALELWQPFSVYAAERRSSTIVIDDLNSTGKEIPANVIVLGSISQSATPGTITISGQLYDTRTQEFSTVEKIPSTLDKAESQAKTLAKSLLAKINKRGEVMADISKGSEEAKKLGSYSNKSNVPAPVEEGSTKFYKTWWFWGSTTAAVLGGAAAYYFLVYKKTSTPSLEIDNPFN